MRERTINHFAMADTPLDKQNEDHQRSCDQDAAHLAFDLARQFITIAIGGIGFTVGLSYAAAPPLSTTIFWSVLGAFAAAIAFGLLFIMHGIGQLSQAKSYNVYIPSLRAISLLQIASVTIGVGLLCLFLRHTNDAPATSITVKTRDTVLTCPNDIHRRHEIQMDGNTVIFSAFAEEYQ